MFELGRGHNGRNNLVTVSSKKFVHIAICISPVHDLWNKFANAIGFRDIEDLVTPLMYFDWEVGVLQINSNNYINNISAKSVREGKRKPEPYRNRVHNRNRDDYEISDDNNNQSVGVRRSLCDGELMKYVKDERFVYPRKYVSAFLDDIYTYWLVSYQQLLPERFTHFQFMATSKAFTHKQKRLLDLIYLWIR